MRRLLFRLVCIVALAWPAFLNGQPFYFPDSTAYVRAADSAAYVFSGHRLRTAWTTQYQAALEPSGEIRDASRHVARRANDLGSDSVMAGRSPYFGALLWVSYLAGDFWPFVIAQAAIALWLIGLSLRLSGLERPATVAGCVALLSALTALPYFTGLLMPDLLGGLAILALLLLAVERGRLGRGQRLGLWALLLFAAIAHLTHILIIAAMAAALALWGLARRWRRRRHLPVVGKALLVALAGFGSVLITSAVVEQAFGRKPLLVPLLTARFMADGPGRDYLRRHCPEAGFTACAWRDAPETGAAAFLWSRDPALRGYMLADMETRRDLSIEDRAFAWAVLREYPVEQGAMILLNGARQLVWFDVDLLNYPCPVAADCWPSLPPGERARLRASLGGRELWPQRAIAIVHYATAAAALLLLLVWIAGPARRGGRANGDLLLWLWLLAVAMLANALLGGGVSDPQPRYQARIIWLLPFVAAIAALLWHRDTRRVGADG